jgi:hypothetical protein
MANNWIELGLSEDEERFVREASNIYKATYLDNFDNVFKIAKAIKILQERHYGMGVQGGFADALVQYGFVARDGENAIDKGIRSNLKELLSNEQKVRDWWKTVPDRKKRDWVSARAIYRRWKASTKLEDPDAPKKPSPLAQERATNIELQQQLHETMQRLKTADGGNQFDLHATSPEQIAGVFLAEWRATPSRLKNLIRTLTAGLKELEARIKEARPAKKARAKREARSAAASPEDERIVRERIAAALARMGGDNGMDR